VAQESRRDLPYAVPFDLALLSRVLKSIPSESNQEIPSTIRKQVL